MKASKAGDKAAKSGAGFKEEVYLDAADSKTYAPATGEAKIGAKVINFVLYNNFSENIFQASAKASDDVWSKDSDYI